MVIAGKQLPPEWSMPDLVRTVLGDEVVQDPSYLADVFSDLSLHGLQSWYWEVQSHSTERRG